MVLCLALGLSALAGLPAVSLTTAMDLLGPDAPVFATREFFTFFGWVSWGQYLTFVPLALLAGLVTQFIFEEQTVTTPVWAPEQE